VRAGNLFLGDLLLDEEGKEVKIASIEEKAGEVTVYNFEVEDNHNYFAEGILVHNADYDEKNGQLQMQAMKQVEVYIENGKMLERPILSGSAVQAIEPIEMFDSNLMNQSLRDLAYITGSNPNLTSSQRIVFVSDLQRAEAALASKDLQARKEALEKIAEVNLQISLLQAQRALNSGFIAEQANRNLKAAEGTIKLIKDQIRDRDLGKSFDEIAKKVFWEQVAITGTHYLKSVEKILGSWISANKVEENVAKGLKEIVYKSQQEYISCPSHYLI
jgi:hypothetical protein